MKDTKKFMKAIKEVLNYIRNIFSSKKQYKRYRKSLKNRISLIFMLYVISFIIFSCLYFVYYLDFYATMFIPMELWFAIIFAVFAILLTAQMWICSRYIYFASRSINQQRRLATAFTMQARRIDATLKYLGKRSESSLPPL
jgi:membrane-associated HD superfamily phosphohydrolase